MLLIPALTAAIRDETEFSCGGEAHIARPLAENTITDAEFAEYLFLRDNPKGVFLERWQHGADAAGSIWRGIPSAMRLSKSMPWAIRRKPKAKAAHAANWRRQEPC